MDFWTNPPPVYNPPIPYVGPIPGSLQDGNMIQIKGRVVPHSNRFHVNLQCGTEPGHCDVAFHFNPRFECPGYVVCNSFENRHWSSEERKHELPIQKGETFQLLILVQNDSYKVAVNDKHFLEFKHRLPLSRVNTICIDGQVEIVSLSFIKNQIQPAVPAGIGNNIQPAVPAGIGNNIIPSNPAFPDFAYPIGNACPMLLDLLSSSSSMFVDPGSSICSLLWFRETTAGPMFPPPGANPFQAGPMFPPPGANPAGSMFPQPAAANPAFPFGPTNPFQAAPMFGPATPANLQVPFKAPIAGGLFPSKSIFIQGTIQPNPDNFVINLKPSNSSDIAFHISSRFRSEQAVVRNSFIQNSWNKEERNLAKNPFVPGQQFEITILCEAQSFKVSVNGCHAFDFNYRYQPIQQINELQIQGDVTLSKVLL